MKFGTIQLDNAVGAILAHGLRHAEGIFKKGRILSREDVKALQAAGHDAIVGARLDVDDIPEDIAAHQVAVAVCGVGASAQAAFTGRSNIHAKIHGVAVVDVARVNALNHLHESLTLATLANHSVVDVKQMIATIKVIPFATPRHVLEKALAIIGAEPLVKVAEFTNKKAGLIITQLPQTKPGLIAKSETSIRERLAALGASLIETVVCGHSQNAVREEIARLNTKDCDPILVFGASAIVDRADVIPAALEEAGGHVIHLGMPVDPGNLMMLGRLGDASVIGVPSCARSPKVNGFDWVLERIVAGLDVTASDIMDMGAGGLLAEISSRPSPRDPQAKQPLAPRVAAIVLAAGRSSRMGTNKMLADFHGLTMVRATVENIRTSAVDEIIVVTGHDDEKIKSALDGINVTFVHNPDFADGMSTSLRCGVGAAEADAVVICLADMPLVKSDVIDRLIAAYNPTENRTIVVPTYRGEFGNPVLWGAEHFPHLMSVQGDRGARGLISQFKTDAVEIDAGTDAVLRDADTPTALADLTASKYS